MKNLKIVNEASAVFEKIKGKDPVMMKKKFIMEDAVYRKSTPGREIAHVECALDCKFCVITAAVIISLAAAALIMCRICKKIGCKC